MAKIRVYELATKLGLDNKVIVDKLNQAGIEVKNHMSALEEEVALKFEAGQSSQADENVEVKVSEKRISSGLIRRRRKTVVKEPEPEEVAPEITAPEAVEETPEVAETVEQVDAAPAEELAEDAPVDEAPVEVVEEPQAEVDAVAVEAPAEKAEKAAPAKKKAKKETGNTAK
ncbi:MAG: translation initiation factor IF-2 N-terminal domain-containing protein, partial [Desulfuromonadales bacterium]|nr:translation initiation factor IF-2 N-terminal domain-containing protein [Desulfuromonadales bacterium]